MDFSVVVGAGVDWIGLDLWACRNARAHNLNNFTSANVLLEIARDLATGARATYTCILPTAPKAKLFTERMDTKITRN
jgi:hypothetical protein